MSIKSRIEVLTERLQSRTDRNGQPLAGYRQNVASIKAELAQLQEQLDGDKS
jgi:hypothetical protein